MCRSLWSRGLRRRSAAARLLRLWVRSPPGAWMFVCSECCVLSGRGLCDEPITRPEESYRHWYVVVCDPEKSHEWGGNSPHWAAEAQWKKCVCVLKHPLSFVVSVSRDMLLSIILNSLWWLLTYIARRAYLLSKTKSDSKNFTVHWNPSQGITNRCDNVQWNLFLCKSTLHVSGGTHAHHQEYNFNCINSHWYLLPPSVAWHGVPGYAGRK